MSGDNSPERDKRRSNDESGPVSREKSSIGFLIRALVKYNASDVHIKPGRPPLFRINGKLVPAKMEELRDEEVQRLIFSTLSGRQIRMLTQSRQLDYSFSAGDVGRFRCNAYYQRGQLSATIRMIPMAVPRLTELGLPPVLKELVHRPRGLFLVTGATGAGKSTTLAALVQHLNETRYSHILLIEDPIEFVYRDSRSSISQREIGSDADSFEEALKAGLRQDPDVIVIGEMRDRSTIQAALTAAETGHLVLSTLHTRDAKSSIDRILDVFPADAQNQIRYQLASSLIGVLSQTLAVRADKSGRVPVCELMVKSPTIEQCLMKDQRERIPEVIASSGTYYKMQTMNQSLEALLVAGTISQDEALRISSNPGDLELRLSGIRREMGYSNTNRIAIESSGGESGASEDEEAC